MKDERYEEPKPTNLGDRIQNTKRRFKEEKRREKTWREGTKKKGVTEKTGAIDKVPDLPPGYDSAPSSREISDTKGGVLGSVQAQSVPAHREEA